MSNGTTTLMSNGTYKTYIQAIIKLSPKELNSLISHPFQFVIQYLSLHCHQVWSQVSGIE